MFGIVTDYKTGHMRVT